MRTARNIAIIAVLALIVDVAPGGGHVADGLLALISITFLALIGAAGYQIYRQYRMDYLGLTDRQRTLLGGSLGAIVLMIAGASELTKTGAGLLVWIAVIALAVFSLIKVWGDSRASY